MQSIYIGVYMCVFCSVYFPLALSFVVVIIGSQALSCSDPYCQSTCLSVSLSFCRSVCLSVCPHFQSSSSPAVLLGVS